MYCRLYNSSCPMTAKSFSNKQKICDIALLVRDNMSAGQFSSMIYDRYGDGGDGIYTLYIWC